jgi:rubredoxin
MDEGSDLVPAALGCPVCHERRMDYLVWTDDEWIKCISCGIIFDSDSWALNEGGEDETR